MTKENIRDYLKGVKSSDLIEELEDRGHMPVLLRDADDNQLYEALGLKVDPPDWLFLHDLVKRKNDADALNFLKKVIEEQTGKILL